MFCLRKKKFWGPSQGGSSSNPSISNIIAESNGSRRGSGETPSARGQGEVTTGRSIMSGISGGHPMHREVTEDTPPDLLEGTMDLLVILPSKKNVRMTVNRRTPIMDLLVQVTTANKINPGSHIVQVRNEIGRELQYKPSTPIGVLDTRTIEIVPKHQVNDYIIGKKQSASAKISSHPFEHTFRLQVHLPKNQLYVMRVGPKTLLQDILEEVCQEKNLDIAKYEIRHPVNLDEKLSLTNRLGDYGIQQVRVVSKNSRINSSVSSADILALQQQQASSTNGRGGTTGYLDSAFNYSRSSVGDSSVSSGSAASARGTSPSRSDDSRSISPVGILPSKVKLRSSLSNASTPSPLPLQTVVLKKSMSSNPLPTGGFTDGHVRPKKRAPPPPVTASTSLPSSSCPSREVTGVTPVRKKEAPLPQSKSIPPAAVPTSSDDHSRHSSASDSSGYHEASASSILSDQQQEMIRGDRSIAIGRKVGTGSLSSLVTTPPYSKPFGMSTGSSTNLTSGLSISTTSISSTSSRHKRKAPKPPGTPALAAPLEEETPPSPSPIERVPLEVQVQVHPTLVGNDEKEPSSSGSGSTISQNQGSQRRPDSFTESTLTNKSGTGSRSSSVASSSGGEKRTSSPVVSITSDLSSSTASPPQSLSPSTPSQVLSTTNSAGAGALIAPPTQPRMRLATNKETLPPLVPDQPQPRPRPKPRPASAGPPQTQVSLPPPVTPLPGAPQPPVSANRNPLSSQSSEESGYSPKKFGVKVLPDNALQELLQARLNQTVASKSKLSNSPTREVPGKPQIADGNVQRPKSQPPLRPAPPPQLASTVGHNLNGLNNSLNSSQIPGRPVRPPPPHSAGTTEEDDGDEGQDSDNLEENLEMFEQKSGRKGQVDKALSTSSESESSSSESESDDGLIRPLKPVPAPGRVPVFRRALSDSRIVEDSEDGDTLSMVSLRGERNGHGPEPSKRVPRDTPQRQRPRTENQESLNRWKNVESLELHLEDGNGPKKKKEDKERKFVKKETETSVRQQPNIPTNKTNQLSLMTFTNDTKLEKVGQGPIRRPGPSSHQLKKGSGDKHEEASSGSEASYADSGLPATATVTPSPVSLDHQDGQEHHSDKSLNSSRRSSLRSGESDHSECWRELLESKVEGQTTDKVLESMFSGLPPTESAGNPNEAATLSPNFTAAAPSPEPQKPEDQKQDEVRGDESQKSSPSPRPNVVKPSMSSRKSSSGSSVPSSSEDEAETAPVTRKLMTPKRVLPKAESFSHPKTESDGKKPWSPPKVAKGHMSRSSSSDEEAESRSSGQGRHKSVSMVNLANKENKIIPPPAIIAAEPLEKSVKVTSLAAFPVMDPSVTPPPSLVNDPKLMETFQVELEHQFEQWKEQFIQRHLRSPTASSIESTSTVDQSQNPNQASGKLNSSSDSLEVSEGEEFDPEKPQAVHSVGGSQPELEEKRETPILGQLEVKVPEPDMKDEVKRREKRDPAPVYRYSGPPAINMGTWGDRPRRSIAVKDDEDYIMGMGQQDAKEPKTSVASRIHGFTGFPVVTSTPKRPPGPNTSRWSNIEVKSPEGVNSNTPLPAVLATWKLATEKAQAPVTTVNVTPAQEKRESGSASATSTLERPPHRSSSNKPAFTISSASSTLERPIGKRTPSPLFTVATPPSPTALTQPPVKEVVIEKLTTSTSMSVTNRRSEGSFVSTPEPNPSSIEDKKKFFQGTGPDVSTKEVNPISQRPHSVQLKTSIYSESRKGTSDDTVDGAGSRSASSASSSSFGSFESPTPSGITLDEKKRFFQGVKPCESPTREVPLPAVNMKSSIATIQRVFEQRSPLASESSSRVTTPTVSATPSPSGTLSRKEQIGGKSQSDAMVQQVLRGKGTGIALEAFRRTPSPAPEPSAGTAVRISMAPNIQNHGNKAIIQVGGESETTNGNFYRQQLKVNGGENGHSFRISVNGGEKATVVVPKQSSSTVVINGGAIPPPPPAPIVPLEESNKGPSKSKIQEMQTLLAQQKLNFVPPPAPGTKIEKRPTTLNGIGKTASVESSSQGMTNGSSRRESSSDNGAGSVPATPTSPQEARAGILSAIKNSGGNFGLKKTADRNKVTVEDYGTTASSSSVIVD